jgi:hypothetical protein
MPNVPNYDSTLRVDTGQTVRKELPVALRAVGLGVVLAGLATAIFVTLQSV